MQIVATLTKHKRENGTQFLAGRIVEPIELPPGARLELRRADLTGDQYELITTSATIPGVDPARARAANAADRASMGRDCIYF